MPAPAPLDETISLAALTDDPYPIYRRLRAEAPAVRVKALGRTLFTKAVDTRFIKENPLLFSSDDPNTPMQRAFLAHTLMRKDHAEHRAERMAMMPAFNPRVIEAEWTPMYRKIAEEYVGRLPRGEIVDLFPALAGPIAARILAELMGLPDASDADMQRWSQNLIDGAGNFGWAPEPFAVTDKANAQMNACIAANATRLRAAPDSSALSVMVNAAAPIPESQIVANIKIAIGGGINEPRDALLTEVFGLLTNPDQLAQVKRGDLWAQAFEESVRWVAPIQVSARVATEDVAVGDCLVTKGEIVMTSQASANRDEDIWENGEAFDALREARPHQAFGNGPHHCMGAQISRRTVGAVLAPLGALVDLAAQKFLVPANKLEYLLSLAWGVAVGRPNQAPARFVARLKDLITLVGGGWKRDPGAHPGDGPRHRIAAPPGPFVLAAGSTPVGGRVGPALARPSGGDPLLAVESVPC